MGFGLGVIAGYIIGKDGKLQPIDYGKLAEVMRDQQPQYMKEVLLDLAIARADEEIPETGNLICVKTVPSRDIPVHIRMNEQSNPQLDLTQIKKISGPFYRFFISNAASSGTMALIIARGYGVDLDDSGQITVIADPADAFGNVHYIGAAELAARLGSPSTYDRRGDVYWWDDFENGIEGWEQTVNGTGALISWTADKSLRGGFSMKLVAGSDGLRKASVKRSFAYPLRTRLGFEMSWTLDDPVNMDYFQGFITLYTGATKIQWGFKTDLAFNYVWTGGMWVAVSPHIPMLGSTYLFYPAKVVVDANTFSYVRFLAGPMSFPVKGLPCSFIPEVTLPRMELVSEGYSKPGMNAVGYFDSVILTQNEPAEP